MTVAARASARFDDLPAVIDGKKRLEVLLSADSDAQVGMQVGERP
jgi:hypothetical protein